MRYAARRKQEYNSPQTKMLALRKLLAWLFAPVGIGCLLLAPIELYVITHVRGHQPSRALFVTAGLTIIGVCNLMAWWTTWKDKPKARAWGLAAGLLTLGPPLKQLGLKHHLSTHAQWEMLVAGTLALIVFAWPDPEPRREFDDSSLPGA